MKWVPRFFPLWVDSNSRGQLYPPSWLYHSPRVKTEENISVARGSAYSACTYFTYPKETVAYPLAHTCRYPCQHLQIRRWWWRQSGLPINLGWEFHLLSPSFPSPYMPIPVILCGPGGWGVSYIRSYRGILVEIGTGSCHAIFLLDAMTRYPFL